MVKITEKNEKQHYVKPEMVALMLESTTLMAAVSGPNNNFTNVTVTDETEEDLSDWD